MKKHSCFYIFEYIYTMKLETSPYSKKINHLSSILIDARQTNKHT